MARISKWDPPRILKELKSWLENPRQRAMIVDEPQRALEQYVTGETVPLGLVGVHFWSLAEWSLALGVAGRSDGCPDASQHLARAAVLGAWGEIVKGALSERYPRRFPPLFFNKVGLALALALAAGQFSEAAQLGRRIGAWVRGKGFHRLDDSALAPFVISLYQDWSGVDAAAEELEPFQGEAYRELLEVWRRDDEVVHSAIEKACDFHVSRSRDDLATQLFEFSGLAYRVLPVEILAVRRLRHELSLPEILTGHELLAPPFGLLPSVQEPEFPGPVRAALVKAKREVAELSKLAG